MNLAVNAAALIMRAQRLPNYVEAFGECREQGATINLQLSLQERRHCLSHRKA